MLWEQNQESSSSWSSNGQNWSTEIKLSSSASANHSFLSCWLNSWTLLYDSCLTHPSWPRSSKTDCQCSSRIVALNQFSSTWKNSSASFISKRTGHWITSKFLSPSWSQWIASLRSVPFKVIILLLHCWPALSTAWWRGIKSGYRSGSRWALLSLPLKTMYR